jgi:hypothetical protein
MAAYHGKSGVVYLSTTGSGNASQVIKLTEWSANMATDRVEVTAFGDTNKTYVQGLRDVTVTFNGVWDDTESKLFTGSTSTDGVKAYLYPSANAVSKYIYGPFWLDASIAVGVAAAVTVSGSMAANGSVGVNL